MVPDGQSWTVAALAPSWLLYPVLYDPFLYERRHLMVVAVVLATVPSFVALLFVSGGLRAGAYFNDSAHTALYLLAAGAVGGFSIGLRRPSSRLDHKEKKRRGSRTAPSLL